MAAKTNLPLIGVSVENADYVVAGLKAGYPSKDFVSEAVIGESSFVQICVVGQSNAGERDNMKAFVSGMAWANAH